MLITEAGRRAVPQPSADPAPSPARGRRRGRASRVARQLARQPGLALAVAVVALVLLAAVWPGLFTARDPLRADPSAILRPPGARHWFGTDELGRDQYARVVHGAVLSLRATLIAVALAFVVGGGIGLLAGFAGGRVEDLLMRMVDVLLAIPAVLLSLAVVTALGYGTTKVAVAVGVASVAGFARVARAEVLKVRQAVFVEAARASGSRWPSVLIHHVAPHAVGPILALAALDVGGAVLAVSALSFLGYGAAPPAPEWGSLISHGRTYLATAWWLSALPGLVLAALVLATSRISRAIDSDRSRQR
ncbi:ABC transporter permease [Frankia sp. CNm7]|nr:ABC transporter permease [Frankia nepalensis]MBL7509261.1 ABC transporter permease [Frankia nepalensis]MBL7522754.1 ABC transporter permease [Frankia nepalensis]